MNAENEFRVLFLRKRMRLDVFYAVVAALGAVAFGAIFVYPAFDGDVVTSFMGSAMLGWVWNFAWPVGLLLVALQFARKAAVARATIVELQNTFATATAMIRSAD